MSVRLARVCDIVKNQPWSPPSRVGSFFADRRYPPIHPKPQGRSMSTFTIIDVERAINYWRELKPAGHDAALCREARVLADAYGQMIYSRADAIDASSLNSEQIQALTSALNQGGPPR
jgi:hypothetical protein